MPENECVRVQCVQHLPTLYKTFILGLTILARKHFRRYRGAIDKPSNYLGELNTALFYFFIIPATKCTTTTRMPPCHPTLKSKLRCFTQTERVLLREYLTALQTDEKHIYTASTRSLTLQRLALKANHL